MRQRLRSNSVAIAGALAGLAAISWLGLYGFAWNDYDAEAAGAMAALVAGHVGRFLSLAPAYGGSFILRAPFALVPKLWGGGELAVYRMLALPCLVASAALGVWLVARMRAAGRDRIARTAVLGLCVANPITLRALEIGHPEELLTAVLCVVAVVTARSGRASTSGLLLGLAVATKAWAILAFPLVLVLLPGTGRRARSAVVAGAVALAVLSPLVLARPAGSLGGGTVVTGQIFQPWQLWWFAGHHGPAVHGLYGALKVGYRTPPTWLGGIPHALIVALAPVLVLLWRRRGGRGEDALLMLALLLLTRCLLDPWNNVYYATGFLIALLAWEAERRPRPLLSLVAVVGVWIVFQELPSRIGADAQAAVYALFGLALAGGLALRLYAPALLGRRRPPAVAVQPG